MLIEDYKDASYVAIFISEIIIINLITILSFIYCQQNINKNEMLMTFF